MSLFGPKCIFFPFRIAFVRLCIFGNMDHRIRNGSCTRTCSGHETISTVARYFSRQCAAYSVGVSYVRNHWHIAVSNLDMCADRAQASFRVVASVFCIVRHSIFIAMRYNVDNIIERARYTFTVPK